MPKNWPTLNFLLWFKSTHSSLSQNHILKQWLQGLIPRSERGFLIVTVTCASATMDSNSVLASLKSRGKIPLFIRQRRSELKLYTIALKCTIPQICPPLSSRATPSAVLGTAWEWKGYSQTTTDRTKYSEKKQQHKKTTRYSDKPSDRQTYASNGSGSNGGASLLETVATFITPVTFLPTTSSHKKNCAYIC